MAKGSQFDPGTQPGRTIPAPQPSTEPGKTAPVPDYTTQPGKTAKSGLTMIPELSINWEPPYEQVLYDLGRS